MNPVIRGGWTQVDEVVPTWDAHDPEPHERKAPDPHREAQRKGQQKRWGGRKVQADPDERQTRRSEAIFF
jgi:hypothetical protein